MKLGELLRQKEFQRLKVLNKNADLDREISTVESTETPDVADYLPQNTLLLTTAMAYKDNPSQLCQLIAHLNALPSAALAVKLGRFLGCLPPDVLEMADRLRFPLLQIPLESTLGEVYHQALAHIWNDKNADLTYALNTQKKFSNLMLQGASMKAMLNNLGYTLECPVAILSPFGGVCECNHSCTGAHLARARTVFQEEALYARWNWETLHFFDENGKKLSIFPIKVVGRYTHYLFVFDAQRLSEAVSALVVEQVLLILGLCLYKNLYLLYNTIKHKEDFIRLLLRRGRENGLSTQQLLDLGEEFALKSSPCYRVIAAALDPKHPKKFDPGNFGYQEERYILLFDWLEKRFEALRPGTVLVFPEPESFRYILLLQGTWPEAEKTLSEIHETLLKLFQVEILFGCGNNRYDLESITQSYREAVESCEDGECREDIAYIRYYRPRDVVELLKTVLNDQTRGLCLHMLKGLAYPRDEMTLELRRTLRTYLDCKCSITETANRMFLHRNTIKYRIKKCQELLETDFTDPDDCFRLQLSLMLVEEADKN